MTREEVSDAARAYASGIAYLREQGMTYDAISARCGISRSRAKQLVDKHQRSQKNLLRGGSAKKMISILQQII